MNLSIFKLNSFLFFKLPAAFFCGIRFVKINEQKCTVSVKHRWINQNPFHSLYFAVQAMAAELTTGGLVSMCVENSGQKIAMLVVGNKAKFMKKAVGRITFICNEGDQIPQIIEKAKSTGAGQTFWMKSIGFDQQGDVVAEMDFEWSIKVRSEKSKIEVN